MFHEIFGCKYSAPPFMRPPLWNEYTDRIGGVAAGEGLIIYFIKRLFPKCLAV